MAKKRLNQVPKKSTKSKKNRLPPSAKLKSTDKEKIAVRLVCNQNNYCFDKLDDQEKIAFSNKLHRLSNLTWQELRNSPRYGLGYEKIPRDQINPAIPSSITQDVSDFIAFRFDDKKPMVGLRKNEIFEVYWFDPKFKLYNHGS